MYRQFTWWVHSKLGHKVRRIVPACVVAAIRSAFPEASGIYVGYRDADTGEDSGSSDEDEQEEQEEEG